MAGQETPVLNLDDIQWHASRRFRGASCFFNMYVQPEGSTSRQFEKFGDTKHASMQRGGSKNSSVAIL